MSLEYSHVVGGPVVQDTAVGGRVEYCSGAHIIYIDHTGLRVVAVKPTNILMVT